MKKLLLIGGTMGVGKTTACQQLKTKLPNSVFLDGDWCWDMNPFVVTPETKTMVMDNICYLLNNFLNCSAYETVIFCWVMHEQGIIDEILSKVNTDTCVCYPISLTCEKEVLAARLQQDIKAGRRNADIVQRTVARLPLYEKLATKKIDVTARTPAETAEEIAKRAGCNGLFGKARE